MRSVAHIITSMAALALLPPAFAFGPPRSILLNKSPVSHRASLPRAVPVSALNPNAAHTMRKLQSRILEAGARSSVAPSTSRRSQRSAAAVTFRVGHLMLQLLRLVGKSLLITLVLQPAIASAAPASFKYLAYLGYGREDGEHLKSDGTMGIAMPVITAGFLLSRATMKRRNKDEVERVKKANEKIRKAEDEFFAVQGEAESDMDIMSELRQRASNATNATDATNGPGPRGPPPRPSGRGPSPSSSQYGGPRPSTPPRAPPPRSPPRSTSRPPPSSTSRPRSSSMPRSTSPQSGRTSRPGQPRAGNADDIARLNRMFNQSKTN